MATKKAEYKKSIVWASTQVENKSFYEINTNFKNFLKFQIKRQYEEKTKQKPPPELLEGLMGQLQLTAS